MSLIRRGRRALKLVGDIWAQEEEVRSDFSQSKTKAQEQAMLRQAHL
jgi:hypothetical protein